MWRHAINVELTESQRALVLVLATAPDSVSVPDLERLWRARLRAVGLRARAGQFEIDMRVIDDSFARTRADYDRLYASVLDTVLAELEATPALVDELVSGACSFEQVERLWRLGTADRDAPSAAC
jgi:hypothetical protein